MSFIANLISPAYYQTKASGLAANAKAYYGPLIRSGSVKPLWHIMFATSIVMYTTNYIALKGEKAYHAREEKKIALEEYYKNHGITPHH